MLHGVLDLESWPHGVMAMMYDVMAAWRLRPGVEA